MPFAKLYPVATTLSGGLDSSSVTCVARDLLNSGEKEPLRTLSMIYDHVPECDEREFINIVVAQGGVEPFYLPSDDAAPLPYFDLASHNDHDDPFDAPNSFLIAGMTALSDLGIRVVLDGFDGDNTVSHGYAYWPELACKGKLITLIREVRALSLRQDRPFLDLLWRKAIRPLTPALVRRTWRLLGGYGNRPWPKQSVISLEFANRIGLAERYRELCSFDLKPLHDAREDHCHGLLSGGLTHHLESTNKMAARFSVEFRHPFFDRRLVEFCLALPHGQKISNGWTRLVFRRAMAGILPEEIRWRVGKLDFRPAFNYAILNVDRPLLDRMFRDCSKALESYVDLTGVKQDLQRFSFRSAGTRSDLLVRCSFVGTVAATIEPEHVKHKRVSLCDRSMSAFAEHEGKRISGRERSGHGRIARRDQRTCGNARTGYEEALLNTGTHSPRRCGKNHRRTEGQRYAGWRDHADPTDVHGSPQRCTLTLLTVLLSSALFHCRILWRAMGLQTW